MQYGDDRVIDVCAHGMPDDVIVTVRNFGAVIPSAQLQTIFEAFTRGDTGLPSK